MGTRVTRGSYNVTVKYVGTYLWYKWKEDDHGHKLLL